jgi:pimeloyl-ACP methyl ester carboxylesterase
VRHFFLVLKLTIAAALLWTNPLSAWQTPAPYRSEPLSVTNGAVTLSGTLTIPNGPGPFPAVVLITGSGGQNRDEEVAGFKVFGVLADHLTRNGIAVYRHDDRGIGQSTGRIATSTTADFADDALAGVARLAAMPEIDPARIGLLGHSEGAAAAAIAAAKSPAVKFIVMLAGSGISGELVTRRQATDAAKAMGATDDAVARIERAYRAVTETLRSGASAEVLAAAVKDLITAQIEAQPAAQRAAIGDVPAFVESRYRQAVATFTSPWMQFFMTFDPAATLRKVTVPVFGAFGTLDTQVLPELNEGPIRQALAGNARATIKVYPEANHLFQRAKTGLVGEYATLEKAFLPGLLDDVTTWIQAATRR